MHATRRILCLLVLSGLTACGAGQEQPRAAAGRTELLAAVPMHSMTAIGDSITRGYNGNGCSVNQGCLGLSCTYGDVPSQSWSVGNDIGSQLCAPPGNPIVSHDERLQCLNGAPLAVDADVAASGATMLNDFYNQSAAAASWLAGQVSPRYVTVWMGHNDICTSTASKTGNTCSSGDQDPDNYCRTTDFAFERELRRGLDQLIQVADLKIGIAAVVRVSELCNLGGTAACGLFYGLSCQQAWSTADALAGVFHSGICKSLTLDCSKQRIVDAYETGLGYRSILMNVSAEYASYAQGGATPVDPTFGTGGVVKAAGVEIVYSDVPWQFRLLARQLNCCDCFHPSGYNAGTASGQNMAAATLFDGLTCSPSTPCCNDAKGTTLQKGLCRFVTTSGASYPGFF